MLKIQFLLPIAFLWCALSTALASDSEIDRASLKGLHGVFVLVEDLNPPEEQAGLKAADIQSDAEEKLRLAGIPLLNKAQSVITPGMPTLYISVSVASSATSDFWPFNIDVDLEQNATLTRNAEVFVPTAITWHVGAIGGVAKSDIPSIRDRVRAQVDRFVRAFLAVNPKK
jgi:hypothetical protein